MYLTSLGNKWLYRVKISTQTIYICCHGLHPAVNNFWRTDSIYTSPSSAVLFLAFLFLPGGYTRRDMYVRSRTMYDEVCARIRSVYPANGKYKVVCTNTRVN